jgi:hypothetical protein
MIVAVKGTGTVGACPACGQMKYIHSFGHNTGMRPVCMPTFQIYAFKDNIKMYSAMCGLDSADSG